MTGSEIQAVDFTRARIDEWVRFDARRTNWPVVYAIDGRRHIYVGETTQLATRLRTHASTKSPTDFGRVRVIMNDTFNKSVCLDLESYLIGMFHADGQYQVTNANAGLSASNYYRRHEYQELFADIFKQLRAEGLFDKSAEEITNSDLFKFSPFKSLSYDQRVAVLAIVESILSDSADHGQISVVHGGPGTGKTIVAIFLMKLLADIGSGREPLETDSDSILTGLFTHENQAALEGFRVGLVVPQQALRKTVQRVFRQTPGLDATMVLSPFNVMEDGPTFDLLIVDEAHRLQQLASTMPTLITKFKRINKALFGDERGGDQLDWLQSRSDRVLLMLDTDQTIRPADIPSGRLRTVASVAANEGRYFSLVSQMRVQADEDYIGYVSDIFSPGLTHPPPKQHFDHYEFEFFDDLRQMKSAIQDREETDGLARLVAGFAWDWASKNDAAAIDISLDGVDLQWNRTATDWINSPTSALEVGSVHTVQGYDLNYAGVIIGPDLRFDEARGGLCVDRDSYRDRKGKINNAMLGHVYTDDELLKYIVNIYRVLLTRGMRGTYVYVCDPGLREYLRPLLSASGLGPVDQNTRTSHIELGPREPQADRFVHPNSGDKPLQ